MSGVGCVMCGGGCRELEALADPLDRAVLAPFQAHCESPEPASWLRAMATKN